jgi:hypothetical protein
MTLNDSERVQKTLETVLDLSKKNLKWPLFLINGNGATIISLCWILVFTGRTLSNPLYGCI